MKNKTKMSDTVKVMNSVKEALLSTTKIDMNRIFNGEKSIDFELENENIQFNYSLTKSEVSTLLRMSLFHLLQFAEKGTLTEYNNHNCRVIIISLLHISNDFDSKKEVGFLKECANSIFKNPLVLQYFLPVYKKKNFIEEMFTDTFLRMCETLCGFHQEFRNIDTILVYKDKFINLLKSSVEKWKTREKTKELVKAEFFRIFPFSTSEIVDLIRIIMELPIDKFFSSNKSSLSIWGITISNLIVALEKNEFSDNVIPLDVDLLRKLFSTLSVVKSKVDTITWEKSLCKYLERFPHNIGAIDKRTFVSLVQNGLDKENVKLVSLLVKRNDADISQFLKIAKKDDSLMKNCDIMFPILGCNLTHNWDKQFLLKLYELHRDEIVKYFSEFSSRSSWIRENVEAVIYLIESTFDSETCRGICDSILVNGDKLVNVDLEYLQLSESCFQKMKMHQEFLQVLIHSLVSTLKLSRSATSLLKNEKKLNILSRMLLTTVETLRKDDEKFVYGGLSKNHFWQQFIRFSLSQCLKFSDNDKTFDNTLFFKAFIAACNIAYEDNSNEEYATTIFGLATSHSEYVNIMLSSSNIKRYLLELLLILVRKNKSIMSSKHVPLYLSAYNASLSECDQIILLILREYENSDIDLSKYRPFLWGNAAASHYSVKTDLVNALWNQPKTSQILDLFLPEMVNNTIAKFPVDRSLKDDSLCAPEEVYDPVFYLSVLCELLSVHNQIAYHRVTHSGALALMLIAGCSNCEQIRLASFTALSRFYFHMENPDVRRSNESLLWVRFIDALRNGIVDLGTSMKEVKLNGFVATFLARSSIVGTQPLHPLYWPLHKFFMARPALKLNNIPEFKKLFYSTEIDYEAHRSWILEVIRDGFRAESDLQIAINSSVFNILLSFYVSSLSDKSTRKLILEIINAVAKLPKSACLLLNYYGIIPWLSAITDGLQSSDMDFVPLLIGIAKNLFDSLEKRNMKDKFSLVIFLQFLFTLKSVMTLKNITVSCFVIYVDILEKILRCKGVYLPEKHAKELLELGENLLGKDLTECQYLLACGSEFASKESKDSLEDGNSGARKSIRNLILRYNYSKTISSKNDKV